MMRCLIKNLTLLILLTQEEKRRIEISSSLLCVSSKTQRKSQQNKQSLLAKNAVDALITFHFPLLAFFFHHAPQNMQKVPTFFLWFKNETFV